MILVIVTGLVLMALLILAADRLAHARVALVRQTILRLIVIFMLLGGLLLWARYWIMYAITCSPNCIGANLVGWDLEEAVLRNSDFVEANLRGAKLNGADLYNADFSGANLAGVNFQDANLRSTRLMGALLARADFRGAEFGDTDLRGAELNEADLTRADLTRTHLQGVTFDNAKLVEAKLAGKNLAGLSLVEADLTGADLSNTDLSGSRLSGANLSGAELAGSNLAGAWLNLADLTGADLRQTNLAGANLLGANLASADLSNSQLVGANLIGARFNGTNLLGANLTDSRLLASELLPVDLLTDPLLQKLNELQQFSVITDVDLAGVRFNRYTKWPMGRTTILTEMLGSRFLTYSLPITATQQTGNDETALAIASSIVAMPLTTSIYRRYVAEGHGLPMLIDNVALDTAFTDFCGGHNLSIVAGNQPISADDLDHCAANGREVVTFTVAIQALAVVVNPQNDFLTNITTDELRALASAKRWSDINLSWPRAEIQRYIPDISTVTFQFWKDKIFAGNAAAVEAVQTNFASAHNSALLVQEVNNDLYAVGMLDYAIYLQNASSLKLLPVDGQIPSEQSISENMYQLTQTIYLFGDANQIRETPSLQDFLAYYLTSVNQLVDQVGVFPVAPESLDAAKQQLSDLQSAGENGEGS